MNYLSIDYGRRRVGVAHSIGNFAEPLLILQHNDDLLSQIEKLCKTHQIDQIVCGISEGAMAEETKEFSKTLQKKLNLPVHFFDETLSSQEVGKMLIQSGKKMKDRRAPSDHFVAAHILEQFLETQVSTQS